MSLQDWSLLVAHLAQFEHPLAHDRDARLLRCERLAECDHDGIGDMARYFVEILAPVIRKNRSPQLVKPYRHHRRIRLTRDQFIAALQFQQYAGSRQFALGKNTDDFALL